MALTRPITNLQHYMDTTFLALNRHLNNDLATLSKNANTD
jgi:hypothetical protein